MKPKSQLIAKVARRNGVSYRTAVKILAGRGGRKSGMTRRRKSAEPKQAELL